jgi:hypothetical protein
MTPVSLQLACDTRCLQVLQSTHWSIFMKCPRCGSGHIANREVGRRTGATVGGLLGAAIGTATTLRGAAAGASLGAMAGPVGFVAGGLTGAIIAGLFAGSAGCAVGSVAGNLADANFLDNRSCLECGHTFREDLAPTAVEVQVSSRARPMEPEQQQAASADGRAPQSMSLHAGPHSMHFHDESDFR